MNLTTYAKHLRIKTKLAREGEESVFNYKMNLNTIKEKERLILKIKLAKV